jgi:hypothetical protein
LISVDQYVCRHDYNHGADELSHVPVASGERVKTSSWQTLQGTSTLAGESARAVAADAGQLRGEFFAIA